MSTRQKCLAVLVFMIIMALFYSVPSYPYGVITHIGQAQHIINMAKAGDPAIPSDIASLITKSPETERAFRSGALDSDIFNALIDKYKLDPNELNRRTHEKCSVLIASILLKNAKTDIEKAYTYGWAFVHLPGDVVGHPFVNLYAGNEGKYGTNPPAKWVYDKSASSGTNAMHCEVEKRFDGNVLNKFGFDEIQTPEGNVIRSPRLDLDIDIPVKLLKEAIGEAFGKSAEPGSYNLERAEIYMQVFLYARANGLIDNNYPQDSRFWDSYDITLERIIDWMKDRNKINDNYNLDDGTANPNGCPEKKLPPIRSSPGGDHPDDTVDAATLQSIGEVSFYDWLRVAIKNGKKRAIFDWQLRNKLDEFKSLPSGTDPVLREQKKKELIDYFKANINSTDVIEPFKENNQALIGDLTTGEDVGILDNGYPQEMTTLLAKFKEPTVKIPQETLLDSMNDKKIIVIPSGGLYGLENSEFFKASLDEYVKQGGTLIVFAQQHGYEFSILPVPQEADGSHKTIGGYGWSEDQSCFVNAAYIETWHQMLAGQSKSTPTLHLDGYFTTYPSNANVLLRRTANGQPALLMYEYGQGQVIATSMYSDFALKQRQSSSEEIALVRDMISWAKKPDELPEVKPGETASVSMEVKNITTNDAVSAKLLIYNPNRSTLLSEQIVSVSIPAGQSTTIQVTYTTTPTSALGIYHIDYTLLDAQGTIIQPQAETDSGRFVVSKPPQSPAQISQLTFAVQSDSEDYVAGSTVNFTIIAFNNSDVDRTVTAKVFDWYSFPVRTQTMVAPARGSTSFAYSKIARPDYKHWGQYYGSLRVLFYENNDYLGASSKIYWVHQPSVKTTVQTDKSLYKNGESVTISTSLKNNIALNWQTTLKITVISSRPALSPIVFEESRTVTLPPYGTVSIVSTFALPPKLVMGTHVVQVFPGTWEYAHTRFEVAQSQISTTPTIPSVFNLSTNNIPFIITNKGKINVSSGVLDLSFKDPDGGIIYSGSQSFALAVGESKTLDVPISIPALKFGNYTLTYTQSDETRAGIPTNITIPNSVDISPSFDKPSYRVRETANLKVDLKNTGKFNLENISLNVSAPDVNYTDTQTISLGVNSSATSLNFPIPIPETISAGRHNVNVTLTLPGGSSIYGTARIIVPQPSLSVGYQGSESLTAGDTLELIIGNTGGVDTTYNAHINITDPSGGHVDSKVVAGLVMAGGQGLISYTLPDQLQEGSYTLAVSVVDSKTLRTTYGYFPFNISGLKGELTVRTDKEVYLSSETTTTLSTLFNQGRPITNGNLHLEIVCANPTPSHEMPVSFHIFTEEGYNNWVERGVLHFPSYFEHQELALPITPDPWGNTYIRIRHEGSQSAFLDYLALRDSNGNIYSPSFVGIAEVTDITSEAQGIDEVAAWVTGQTFYAFWDNLPSGVSYTLVMVAKEGCGIVWQTDTTINQGSGITDTLNISAGNIGQVGKFYLRGTLSNSLGQIIALSDYPFYVIDGDTVLLFNTDKRIYRSGETVTITGRIENRAPIVAENMTLTLNANQEGQGPQLLLTETVNIPAGGTYPFTITTTAGAEGVVTLSGRVKQNNEVLVSITDQYEVAFPYVSAYVNVPDMVGNEPFTIEVEIWNDGNVDAIVQFGVQSPDFGDSQAITVPPGETRLIQYQQQIHQATAYTFTFSGDLGQSFTRTVSYGLEASIQFGVGGSEFGVFSEGSVALPVTLTNTGQSTVTLEVTYQLNPRATQQSKTYSLPVGGSATDTLYFDLAEGDYQISASSQRPDATAQANFSVRKENQVEMAVSLDTQTGGLIPVNVNLTNLGYNEISGSVNVSVSPSTGQAVWNGGEPISQLLPQSSQLITLNINPSAIEPGNYNLQVQLLNNSNHLIATQSSSFGVQSANFQITQLPPYQTFFPGQEATFIFRVRNTGNQEGTFDLRLKSYDLIESTQREWLKPGEEKAVTFSFMLPEDLEEKDYFANYELIQSEAQVKLKGQIKYHLAGINLNVNATLDKPYYSEGETAHLTISIQTSNPIPQNLFARVNYAGFEPQQTFTLNGSQVLIFDVPLPQITGEKLFYGIYHESGRSIHLNSLYIHKAGEVITITTNKQVYNPGEVVSVSVSGNTSGNMTLSGPGGYEETFPFSGQVARNFTLPSTMTAGTYFINLQLSTSNSELITAVHPFDIAGIQVKVLECHNDKGKYAATNTIITSLTISSNTTMPAILKAWIVDPTGQYTSVGEQSISLSSSANSPVTYQSPLVTSVSGIHRLVYGIYGPEDLLLCSGSEAFDVGDAVILGLTTDKRDYPTNTEPFIVTASLFGSVNANIQLEIDGIPIKSESISLNGFMTYTTELQNITPGPHTLKATLTAGGLKSTKETSFTYALSLMPKPEISALPASHDFGNVNLGSTSTKTITLSSTGNANLVIGMVALSGINQGEFTIQNDGCSGNTITPSGTCTLDILFSPTSLGAKSASLSIPSNATTTLTLFLPLSGTGVTILNLNISINPMGGGRVTGTGIDCPGDCVESFSASGAAIQLTATPTEGYRFVNWTGDINPTDNPGTVDMDTNKNVTVNFAISAYTIHAIAGSGGIISPPGSVTVNHGASQTFTITPDAGYRVAEVKVDGVSVGAVLTYTFSNLTSDRTIEVIFAVNQYTITATAGLNGTITPSGSITVNHGASQTFTITPSAGYHVADVKVGGVSVGEVTTFTFNNVTSNHTIEVTFAIDNRPPVADAGPDRNVITGQVVTLNGSNSYDPEGAMITFLWTFVEVPAGSSVTDASLSDVTSAKPQFTPDVSGAYRLQLIVNDGALDSVADEALINATTPNVPPNADAGPDRNVFTGNIVQLDGSRSSDPDNGPLPLSYLWSSLAKPAGSLLTDHHIVNRNMPNATFVPDVNGLYELMLTVSDGHLSSEDTVQIMATISNVPPNANAGADRTIYLGDAAALDGSASNDPDHGPQPLAYLWSFVAIPTGSQLTYGHISGVNTVSPSFTPDVVGTYVLELMVYDGIDAGFDNVAVTAIKNQSPNSAPTGGEVYEFNTPVILGGQVSDFDGDLITYEWLEGNRLLYSGQIGTIYGGSPVNLPEQAIYLGVGTHMITLRVSDGFNLPVTSNVMIQVIDTTAPVLSPISNKTILWPPNHKMVDITIWANASDNTGHPVALSAVVSSNEPQDGLGDGDTSPDWTEPVIDQINGIITLKLRSERSGRGNGRIYTITITARDASGNRSQANVEIRVPHSR